MTITQNHPRHEAEADSSFSELFQHAQPGDIVRRVHELAGGTIIAAEGVVATIEDDAIKDSGGAILAEADDDENDYVLIYHQAAQGKHPDPTVHHWVQDAKTGWLFFADTKENIYREVTTHTMRVPESFNSWHAMEMRRVTTAANPNQAHQWSPVGDPQSVRVGDAIMRQVNLASGTLLVVKGTVAAITVEHEGNSATPSMVTQDGAVLYGASNDMGSLNDSADTIWHQPQMVS